MLRRGDDAGGDLREWHLIRRVEDAEAERHLEHAAQGLVHNLFGYQSLLHRRGDGRRVLLVVVVAAGQQRAGDRFFLARGDLVALD